jgi:hypothetical protein
MAVVETVVVLNRRPAVRRHRSVAVVDQVPHQEVPPG